MMGRSNSMHSFRYFLSVLFILLVSACGSVGKDFDTQLIDGIKKGETTQVQILDMFGLPFKEGTEDNRTMWTYQWDYWSLFEDNKSKGLVILFNDKNRVLAYRYTTTDFKKQTPEK